MDQHQITDLQSSYDRVAAEYVQRIYHELDHKSLDRQLLDRFAAGVQSLGPACDLGCGPGHVARYLRERGVDVCGIDLSPGMIEQARQLNPGIEFRQGDMLALDAEDGTWGGIAAFYSIIHIPREEVTSALREMRRVLRGGGLLLLAFHAGEEIIHLEEWWGHPVSLDFLFFRPDEMAGYLTSAGFEIEEVITRPPYADVEYPSHRAYIFAKKVETQPECVICRGASGDAELHRIQVWEDALWRLTVSLDAEVLGFAYLEPRRHIPHITDLDGEEARTFGEVLARVSRVLREETDAELIYIYVFGGGVPHLHVHLAPHRPGDALNTQMIRGEVVVEKMESGAGRYVSKDFPPLPEAEQRAVAQRIQQRLGSEG